MSLTQTPEDRSWFAILVVALILGMFAWIAIALEDAGAVRETTNKAKLCSCVIQVNELPEAV